LTKDLYTSQELLRLFDPTERTKVTAQGLGITLKKAGARQVAEGRPIRANGRQDRYYAIRNATKWLQARPADLIAHLEAADPPRLAKY
jgi:hypothetical protein